MCDSPAPFKDKKEEPYLETHHIEWLSQGGTDTIDNTVTLCPNCHRKMHTLNLNSDIEKLKLKI
ncbi:HNH endonuclease [Desulfocucumis palustris]|uniref:HNH endonuclease n=1 Tax=Desulfocucumis palustris TaxID=1898651 RepID=UPI001E577DB8|nr:HNH endonuclease [Desulfocucumis palustris]